MLHSSPKWAALLVALMLAASLAGCAFPGAAAATGTDVPEMTEPSGEGVGETPASPTEPTPASTTDKAEKPAATPAESVSVAESALTIEVGKTAAITTTVAPANASEAALTFTSSDKGIATVNAKGVVTGVKTGSATVTVSTQNGKTATVKITVRAATTTKVQPTGMHATLAAASITAGKTTTISVTFTPANTTEKEVTFTSSNPAVAKVNASGTVTGVAAGKATITAATPNGITVSLELTVTAAASGTAATSMGAYPDKLPLYVGETGNIQVTLTPANATTVITFTSANSAIATVDKTGTVKAVSAGSTKVTVTSDNGMSLSVDIIVSAAETASPGATGTYHSDYDSEVFRLVNEQRAAAGLSALTYNSNRQSLADARAFELVSDASHNGMRNCNGENIAGGQTTPAEAMDSWMNSPGHRANILTAEFTSMTVGCYEEDGFFYWVQLFYV